MLSLVALFFSVPSAYIALSDIFREFPSINVSLFALPEAYITPVGVGAKFDYLVVNESKRAVIFREMEFRVDSFKGAMNYGNTSISINGIPWTGKLPVELESDKSLVVSVNASVNSGNITWKDRGARLLESKSKSLLPKDQKVLPIVEDLFASEFIVSVMSDGQDFTGNDYEGPFPPKVAGFFGPGPCIEDILNDPVVCGHLSLITSGKESFTSEPYTAGFIVNKTLRDIFE